MSKKVVVYDASVVFDNLSTTASRSGVFWVALNLLREFLVCSDFKVLIYCRDYNIVNIAELKKLIPGLAGIEFLESINPKSRLIKKRKFFTDKRNFYKHKNFFLHLWYGIYSEICTHAVNALKSTIDYKICNVFVSPMAAVPPEFARRDSYQKVHCSL